MSTDNLDAKIAVLYRMVRPKHICPYGLKSRDLLRRHGYTVKDYHLASRDEVDAFKVKYGVETTPQTFIGGKRIGGYDALARHLGKRVPDPNEMTYRPIIALFSVAALLAIAMTEAAYGTLFIGRTVEWFISVSMVLLGLQKLSNIDRFATMFLSYDLLAQRWVRYCYVYPFAETGAGLLMTAGALIWLASPVALIVAGIGAVSVFKAVYIDRRELICACVGGDSRVPLGFISLTENIMMVTMALWMLAKAIWIA